MSLDTSLSVLFTPRQIEIIKKKYIGEKLTKTEAEIYSRTIKKKISALTNLDVQRIAQALR